MIQYISTRDEMVKDERITVARCFDSYWTADACRVEGERIFRLVDVRYATRAPQPGDRLRVVSHEGILRPLPPHRNDGLDGNPVPVRA